MKVKFIFLIFILPIICGKNNHIELDVSIVPKSQSLIINIDDYMEVLI
jgi:hypothetical protein